MPRPVGSVVGRMRDPRPGDKTRKCSYTLRGSTADHVEAEARQRGISVSSCADELLSASLAILGYRPQERDVA